MEPKLIVFSDGPEPVKPRIICQDFLEIRDIQVEEVTQLSMFGLNIQLRAQKYKILDHECCQEPTIDRMAASVPSEDKTNADIQVLSPCASVPYLATELEPSTQESHTEEEKVVEVEDLDWRDPFSQALHLTLLNVTSSQSCPLTCFRTQ